MQQSRTEKGKLEEMTTDTRSNAIPEAARADVQSFEHASAWPPSPARERPFPAPEVAAYWAERRRYLERIRKTPEMRQRYWKAAGIYLLRRVLWSFGFFPIFLAFWIPFVLASFNPVVMVADLLPVLQDFVNSNPEVQANTVSTLVIAWASVGFFFLVFDFVLTPFKSPYDYEADVYMRTWEQLNHDQLPDKV